jgi:hypothetical protein
MQIGRRHAGHACRDSLFLIIFSNIRVDLLKIRQAVALGYPTSTCWLSVTGAYFIVVSFTLFKISL